MLSRNWIAWRLWNPILAVLERRMQEKAATLCKQLALLDEIPGVDGTLAAIIIAELGIDIRAEGTYLRDTFYRLKARPGYKRAAALPIKS